MQILEVSIEQFNKDIVRIGGWLKDLAAVSKGEFNAGYLMDCIGKGTHKMYYYAPEGEPVGMIMTTVVDFLVGKTLLVVGAAGEFKASPAYATELFNTLAKEQDCISMEMVGRQGWVRTFKAHDWTVKHVTIEHPVY